MNCFQYFMHSLPIILQKEHYCHDCWLGLGILVTHFVLPTDDESNNIFLRVSPSFQKQGHNNGQEVKY
jgi:hypothetical protein